MKKRVLAIVAIIALVAVLGVCLVACNAEDYGKRLEKAGYTVTVSEDNSAAVKTAEATLVLEGGYEGGIEFIVTGAKGRENVIIVKFDKAKDAKRYVEKHGGDSTKRTDKYVFNGTEQGIKDAK